MASKSQTTTVTVIPSKELAPPPKIGDTLSKDIPAPKSYPIGSTGRGGGTSNESNSSANIIPSLSSPPPIELPPILTPPPSPFEEPPKTVGTPQERYRSYSPSGASGTGRTTSIPSDAPASSAPPETVTATVQAGGGVKVGDVTYYGQATIPYIGKTANQLEQEAFEEAKAQGITRGGSYKYTTVYQKSGAPVSKIVEESPIVQARKDFYAATSSPDIERYTKAGYTPKEAFALSQYSAATKKTPTGEVAESYLKSVGKFEGYEARARAKGLESGRASAVAAEDVFIEPLVFLPTRAFSDYVYKNYEYVASKGTLGIGIAATTKLIADVAPKGYLETGEIIVLSGFASVFPRTIKYGLAGVTSFETTKSFVSGDVVSGVEGAIGTGLILSVPTKKKYDELIESSLLKKSDTKIKKIGETKDLLKEQRINLKVDELREFPLIKKFIETRQFLDKTGTKIKGSVEKGSRYISSKIEIGFDYTRSNIKNIRNKLLGSPPNLNAEQLSKGIESLRDIGNLGIPLNKIELAKARNYVRDSFKLLGKRTEYLLTEPIGTKRYGSLGKVPPLEFTPEEVSLAKSYFERLPTAKEDISNVRSYVRKSFSMLGERVISLKEKNLIYSPRAIISIPKFESFLKFEPMIEKRILDYKDYGLIGKPSKPRKIADSFIIAKPTKLDKTILQESFRLLGKRTDELLLGGSEYGTLGKKGDIIFPKLQDKIVGRYTQAAEKIEIFRRALKPKVKLREDRLPFNEELFLEERSKFLAERGLSQGGLSDANIKKILEEKPIQQQIKQRLKETRQTEAGLPKDLKDTVLQNLREERLSDLTTKTLGSTQRPTITFIEEPKLPKDQGTIVQTRRGTMQILKEPEQILKRPEQVLENPKQQLGVINREQDVFSPAKTTDVSLPDFSLRGRLFFRESPVVQPIQDVFFANSQSQFSKTKTESVVNTSLAQSSVQRFATPNQSKIQNSKVAQQQRQILREELIFRQPEITRQVTKFGEVEIPRELKRLKNKRKERPSPFIRKVKTFSVSLKKRGQFKPIASGLSRGQALRFGSEKALTDIARTFRIAPSGTKEIFGIDEQDFMPSETKFRGYKIRAGKKLPLIDTFIQRTQANLQSREERFQLAEARRLKKLIGI